MKEKIHEHAGGKESYQPHPSKQVEPEQNSMKMIILFIMAGLVVALAAFNQIQMTDLKADINSLSFASAQNGAATVAKTAATTSTQNAPAQTISAAELNALAEKVIPRGVPPIYGAELGVSFDEPVQSLSILAAMDDPTKLSPDELKRYTEITLQISCEYCCGADSIVFPNGQAACGCQHSFAMRALGQYLVKNHGNEFTDEQILEELGKWKTMFFPKQILEKALQFQTAGKDINTVDLTSNRFRGFKAQTAAAGIGGLPEMVGGC
jgi:hypothetical protein